MEVPEYLKNIAPVSDSFRKEIESVFTRIEFKKGEFIFRQGELCKYIYFIEKGLARIFYYSQSGKEVTFWFFAENSFLTSADSFFNHQESRENCEVLEDSVVYAINYSDLDELLNKGQGGRLAFYALFDITSKMSDFITGIKFQTAKERYNSLMDRFPSIFLRAPLTYIASFLGITPETLSRIRAKK